MGANAHLESSGSEPRLVQSPTLADLAKNLRFVHTTVFKHQLARFAARDRRDAARDVIARRSGVDQKTSNPVATAGARQTSEELDEISDVGKRWEHLRAVDHEKVAVRSCRRLHHGGVRAGGGLAQTECRSLFAANTRPKIFFDLISGAAIQDIRDMIAQLERNRALFELLCPRDQRDIADFQAAILFRHVEVPQPFGFRFHLEIFHDAEVALDLGIFTRFDPAFPSAALENVGSVGDFRLQWDELITNESLDTLAQTFFFGGETKVHGGFLAFLSRNGGAQCDC